MKGAVAALVATVLLAISHAALAEEAADAPLRVLRTWALGERDPPDAGRPAPTHRMRLEMAIVSGTRWDPEAVLAAARDAATILAQCGISLDSARLQEFEGPERYRYLSTPVSRELARRSGLPKPAIFFVDDTLQRPAFDAEAIGRANATRRPEMADTVWITAATPDVGIALAHELVHVLSESGAHSEVPGNLMRAETALGQTQLSAGQCGEVIVTGAAKGLLRKVTKAGTDPN